MEKIDMVCKWRNVTVVAALSKMENAEIMAKILLLSLSRGI